MTKYTSLYGTFLKGNHASVKHHNCQNTLKPHTIRARFQPLNTMCEYTILIFYTPNHRIGTIHRPTETTVPRLFVLVKCDKFMFVTQDLFNPLIIIITMIIKIPQKCPFAAELIGLKRTTEEH